MSREVRPESGVELPRETREALAAPALGEISLQPRRQLEVILRHDSLRIEQKAIPLRLPYEQVDYSPYRSGFLRSVIARQSLEEAPHAFVRPLDVWSDMGYSGKFPTDLMIGVKRWLPYVSYRRQHLIEGNGKRGRGAFYSVNNAYLLKLIDASQEKQPAMPELPDLAEVREAVRHLTQFNFLFNERGVLTVDPMVEIALEQHRPDYSQLRAEGGTIEDFRAASLLKFGMLLEDKAYLHEFRRGYGPKSVQEVLASYISDLDPNERFFVKTLLSSTLEPVAEAGKVRLEAIDRRGMLLGVLYPSAADKREILNEPTSNQPEVIFERRQTTTEELKKEVSLRDERLEGLLEIVEAVANDVAATFLTTLNAAKSYRLAQIQAVFPKLTTNKLMSAKENRVINPVREQPISLEDVIRILIHSDVYLRNVFTTRKYKDRIEEIINRVIEENLKRVEEELGGQED